MPLRVVFDARHARDFGFGTYIRNLLAGFVESGSEDQFTLIARKSDAAEFEELPSNFHLEWYEHDDSARIEHLRFPLYLRKYRADLYHIPLNVVPLTMPRPYVVTVHDLSSLLYEPLPGWRQDLRLYRMQRGLLRAARVIAVSEATRHDVEHLLGIPSSHVRRIYGAPDPRFAHANEAPSEEEFLERRRILARYDITYPFLLYAGAIRPQKNIPRLVEAFALLLGELQKHPVYKDLRLIIIGDQISRDPAVRRAVIHSRIQPMVRFLGFVPHETLRIFYESAAAFVFPSLYEGFGLPPLEAMAAGTPVVASNVTSLPEVVGDAARLVSPDNVFDIMRGMKEVLIDEELRRELRVRGFDRLKRFSWVETARAVLETYHEAVGQKA